MTRLKIELPPRPPPEAFEGASPALVAYVEALESTLRRVLGVIEELSAEVEQARREGKRQATPFRRKKRVKDRKKPGRKGGHLQQRRAAPEHVDEEHDAPHPDRCPCCDSEHVEEVDTYEQVQEEIVTRVITRRFTIHRGICAECGHQMEGRHPFQISTARGAASHQLGPEALALATKLHFGEGMPFDKVREHLLDLGLRVSVSTLVRATERIAVRGQATFDALLRQVLSQDVLHIDETGWSVDGKPCWLWVLSGVGATVYFVRETRGSCEVEDFLKDFAGVLVTDGAKAYDKLGKTLTRALCLLHLRRNVRELSASQTRGAVCVPRALDEWLGRVIELVGRRVKMEPDDWQAKSSELHNEFQQVFLGCKPTNEANRSMIERIVTWQDAILRCLHDERVPATNNHAERQIRPAVVLRKRGGCSRSERGARTYEVLTSLLVTARQRRVDFVGWLVGLLRQPQPLAPAPFW